MIDDVDVSGSPTEEYNKTEEAINYEIEFFVWIFKKHIEKVTL